MGHRKVSMTLLCGTLVLILATVSLADTNEVADTEQNEDVIDSALIEEKLANPTCNGKADIVFIVDSSTSVSDENFVLQMKFVENMCSGWSIGPDDTRVALIVFNDDVILNFGLDKYSKKEDVMKAIRAVVRTEGTTSTGEALQLARTQVLNKARKNVPRLVILLTDGKATDGLGQFHESSEIKRSGAVIFGIGIGNLETPNDMNETEVRMVATKDHFYLARDFSNLASIIDGIRTQACKTIKECPPSQTIHGKCEKGESSVTEVTSKRQGDSCTVSTSVKTEPCGPAKPVVCPKDTTEETKCIEGLLTRTITTHKVVGRGCETKVLRETKSCGPPPTPKPEPCPTNLRQVEVTKCVNGKQTEIITTYSRVPGGCRHMTNTTQKSCTVPPPICAKPTERVIPCNKEGKIVVITATSKPVGDKCVTVETRTTKPCPGPVTPIVCSRSSQQLLPCIAGSQEKITISQQLKNGSCVSNVVKVTLKCGDKFEPPCPMYECLGHSVVDIIFLLDASNEVGVGNFRLMKKFVIESVRRLDVPRLARIGVVTVGKRIVINFDTTRFSSRSAIIEAIDKIEYIGGEERPIGDGMYVIREQLTYHLRAHAGRTVVVVSSGVSNHGRAVYREAAQLREFGYYVVSFVVSSKMEAREQIEIVSSSKFFEAKTYELLVSYSYQLVTFRIQWFIHQVIGSSYSCRKPVYYPGECKQGFQQVFRMTFQNVNSGCVPITTLETTRPCGCQGHYCFRSSVMDIVFVIDSSASTGKGNFTELLDFTAEVVDKIDVGKNIRVGVVVFGGSGKVVIPITNAYSKSELIQQIRKITFIGGLRATGYGLKVARTHLHLYERHTIAKVIFLLTGGDAEFSYDIYKESRITRRWGFTTIAIGVSEWSSNYELSRITYSGIYMRFITYTQLRVAIPYVINMRFIWLIRTGKPIPVACPRGYKKISPCFNGLQTFIDVYNIRVGRLCVERVKRVVAECGCPRPSFVLKACKSGQVATELVKVVYTRNQNGSCATKEILLRRPKCGCQGPQSTSLTVKWTRQCYRGNFRKLLIYFESREGKCSIASVVVGRRLCCRRTQYAVRNCRAGQNQTVIVQVRSLYRNGKCITRERAIRRIQCGCKGALFSTIQTIRSVKCENGYFANKLIYNEFRNGICSSQSLELTRRRCCRSPIYVIRKCQKGKPTTPVIRVAFSHVNGKCQRQLQTIAQAKCGCTGYSSYRLTILRTRQCVLGQRTVYLKYREFVNNKCQSTKIIIEKRACCGEVKFVVRPCLEKQEKTSVLAYVPKLVGGKCATVEHLLYEARCGCKGPQASSLVVRRQKFCYHGYRRTHLLFYEIRNRQCIRVKVLLRKRRCCRVDYLKVDRCARPTDQTQLLHIQSFRRGFHCVTKRTVLAKFGCGCPETTYRRISYVDTAPCTNGHKDIHVRYSYFKDGHCNTATVLYKKVRCVVCSKPVVSRGDCILGKRQVTTITYERKRLRCIPVTSRSTEVCVVPTLPPCPKDELGKVAVKCEFGKRAVTNTVYRRVGAVCQANITVVNFIICPPPVCPNESYQMKACARGQKFTQLVLVAYSVSNYECVRKETWVANVSCGCTEEQSKQITLRKVICLRGYTRTVVEYNTFRQGVCKRVQRTILKVRCCPAPLLVRKPCLPKENVTMVAVIINRYRGGKCIPREFPIRRVSCKCNAQVKLLNPSDCVRGYLRTYVELTDFIDGKCQTIKVQSRKKPCCPRPFYNVKACPKGSKGSLSYGWFEYKNGKCIPHTKVIRTVNCGCPTRVRRTSKCVEGKRIQDVLIQELVGGKCEKIRVTVNKDLPCCPKAKLQIEHCSPKNPVALIYGNFFGNRNGKCTPFKKLIKRIQCGNCDKKQLNRVRIYTSKVCLHGYRRTYLVYREFINGQCRRQSVVIKQHRCCHRKHYRILKCEKGQASTKLVRVIYYRSRFHCLRKAVPILNIACGCAAESFKDIKIVVSRSCTNQKRDIQLAYYNFISGKCERQFHTIYSLKCCPSPSLELKECTKDQKFTSVVAVSYRPILKQCKRLQKVVWSKVLCGCSQKAITISKSEPCYRGFNRTYVVLNQRNSKGDCQTSKVLIYSKRCCAKSAVVKQPCGNKTTTNLVRAYYRFEKGVCKPYQRVLKVLQCKCDSPIVKSRDDSCATGYKIEFAEYKKWVGGVCKLVKNVISRTQCCRSPYTRSLPCNSTLTKGRVIKGTFLFKAGKCEEKIEVIKEFNCGCTEKELSRTREVFDRCVKGRRNRFVIFYEHSNGKCVEQKEKKESVLCCSRRITFTAKLCDSVQKESNIIKTFEVLEKGKCVKKSKMIHRHQCGCDRKKASQTRVFTEGCVRGYRRTFLGYYTFRKGICIPRTLLLRKKRCCRRSYFRVSECQGNQKTTNLTHVSYQRVASSCVRYEKIVRQITCGCPKNVFGILRVTSDRNCVKEQRAIRINYNEIENGVCKSASFVIKSIKCCPEPEIKVLPCDGKRKSAVVTRTRYILRANKCLPRTVLIKKSECGCNTTREIVRSEHCFDGLRRTYVRYFGKLNGKCVQLRAVISREKCCDRVTHEVEECTPKKTKTRLLEVTYTSKLNACIRSEKVIRELACGCPELNYRNIEKTRDKVCLNNEERELLTVSEMRNGKCERVTVTISKVVCKPIPVVCPADGIFNTSCDDWTQSRYSVKYTKNQNGQCVEDRKVIISWDCPPCPPSFFRISDCDRNGKKIRYRIDYRRSKSACLENAVKIETLECPVPTTRSPPTRKPDTVTTLPPRPKPVPTTANPKPKPATTEAPKPKPATTAAPKPKPEITTTAAPKPKPATTAAPKPKPEITTTAAPKPKPVATTTAPKPVPVVCPKDSYVIEECAKTGQTRTRLVRVQYNRTALGVCVKSVTVIRQVTCGCTGRNATEVAVIEGPLCFRGVTTIHILYYSYNSKKKICHQRKFIISRKRCCPKPEIVRLPCEPKSAETSVLRVYYIYSQRVCKRQQKVILRVPCQCPLSIKTITPKTCERGFFRTYTETNTVVNGKCETVRMLIRKKPCCKRDFLHIKSCTSSTQKTTDLIRSYYVYENSGCHLRTEVLKKVNCPCKSHDNLHIEKTKSKCVKGQVTESATLSETRENRCSKVAITIRILPCCPEDVIASEPCSASKTTVALTLTHYVVHDNKCVPETRLTGYRECQGCTTEQLAKRRIVTSKVCFKGFIRTYAYFYHFTNGKCVEDKSVIRRARCCFRTHYKIKPCTKSSSTAKLVLVIYSRSKDICKRTEKLITAVGCGCPPLAYNIVRLVRGPCVAGKRQIQIAYSDFRDGKCSISSFTVRVVKCTSCPSTSVVNKPCVSGQNYTQAISVAYKIVKRKCVAIETVVTAKLPCPCPAGSTKNMTTETDEPCFRGYNTTYTAYFAFVDGTCKKIRSVLTSVPCCGRPQIQRKPCLKDQAETTVVSISYNWVNRACQPQETIVQRIPCKCDPKVTPVKENTCHIDGYNRTYAEYSELKDDKCVKARRIIKRERCCPRPFYDKKKCTKAQPKTQLIYGTFVYKDGKCQVQSKVLSEVTCCGPEDREWTKVIPDQCVNGQRNINLIYTDVVGGKCVEKKISVDKVRCCPSRSLTVKPCSEKQNKTVLSVKYYKFRNGKCQEFNKDLLSIDCGCGKTLFDRISTSTERCVQGYRRTYLRYYTSVSGRCLPRQIIVSRRKCCRRSRFVILPCKTPLGKTQLQYIRYHRKSWQCVRTVKVLSEIQCGCTGVEATVIRLVRNRVCKNNHRSLEVHFNQLKNGVCTDSVVVYRRIKCCPRPKVVVQPCTSNQVNTTAVVVASIYARGRCREVKATIGGFSCGCPKAPVISQSRRCYRGVRRTYITMSVRRNGQCVSIRAVVRRRPCCLRQYYKIERCLANQKSARLLFVRYTLTRNLCKREEKAIVPVACGCPVKLYRKVKIVVGTECTQRGRPTYLVYNEWKNGKCEEARYVTGYSICTGAKCQSGKLAVTGCIDGKRAIYKVEYKPVGEKCQPRSTVIALLPCSDVCTVIPKWHLASGCCENNLKPVFRVTYRLDSTRVCRYGIKYLGSMSCQPCLTDAEKKSTLEKFQKLLI